MALKTGTIIRVLRKHQLAYLVDPKGVPYVFPFTKILHYLAGNLPNLKLQSKVYFRQREGLIQSVIIPDRCQICLGRKGGVPGNENITTNKIYCDYCWAAKRRRLGKLKRARLAKQSNSQPKTQSTIQQP